MGSWISGQSVNGIKIIKVSKSQTTLSYLMYVEVYSLIIVSWLLESVCLCPIMSDPIMGLLL
jgi:hypothetical protein